MNREYSSRVSTLPCGVLVLRIRVEMFLPTHILESVGEVQNPVANVVPGPAVYASN